MNITKKIAKEYISRRITEEEIKRVQTMDRAKYYAVAEIVPEGEVVSIYEKGTIDKLDRLPKYTVIANEKSHISAIRELDGSVKWSFKSIISLLFESEYYFSSNKYTECEILMSEKGDTEVKSLLDRIHAIQVALRDQKRDDADRKTKEYFKERMDLVPALEDDFESWVENVATQTDRYIFYRKKGSTITGHCSYCKNEVTLKEATHLETGKCPCCKSTVTYRSRGLSKNLFDRFNFHLIQNTKEGMVVRYFYATKSYRDDLRKPEVKYLETHRCLVKDKNIRNLEWYKWDFFKRDNTKSWVQSAVYLYQLEAGVTYRKNLKKVLKNTALEKCAIDTFAETVLFEPIEYFFKYLEEPCRAILAKEKLYKLAFNHYFGLELNKEATSAEELLNVSRATIRMARKIDANIHTMKLLIALAEVAGTFTFNEFKKAHELFGTSEYMAKRFLSHTTINELYEYATNQLVEFKRTVSGIGIERVIDKLTDYWKILNSKEVPFSKEVWFPNNLRETLFNIVEETAEHKVKKLPKEFDQRIMIDGFDNYIFYYKDNVETKAYCSHCKTEFKITNPVYNEEAVCPCCSKHGILKQKGRAKQLRDNLISYCVQKYRKGILVRGFVCQRTFENGYTKPSIWKEEAFRYTLKSDGTQNKEYRYSLTCGRWLRLYSYESSNNKKNGTKQFIFTNNLEKELNNTPWKYAALGELNTLSENINPNLYLMKYPEYPQLEFLVKMKLEHLVNVILKDSRYSINTIFNEKELSPLKFLGIQKQTLKQVIALSPTLKEFKILREIENYNLSLDKKHRKLTIKETELSLAAEMLPSTDRIVELLKETTVSRLYKYLNEQPTKGTYYNETKLSRLTGEWLDYRKMGNNIIKSALTQNKLIKEFPMFPKNLKEFHDLTTTLYRDHELEIKSEIIKCKQEELSKYEYVDEEAGYLITAPKDAYEFLNESNSLNHCVKTYMDRVIEGKTTILFVRSISEPTKPLYTLEYSNNKVVQFRGHSNSEPAASAKKFIKKWDTWLMMKEDPKFENEWSSMIRRELERKSSIKEVC